MKEISEKILRNLGIDENTPFDASQDSAGFLFVFDVDQENKFSIQNFADKDKIKFVNTPTKNKKDVKIKTKDYNSGKSILTCGDVDIYLSNLKSSHFWNVDTFRKVFKDESLIVGD